MNNNLEQQFSNKFYHKLFFKVYLYFGIMLVIFAILIGAIFIRLNSENTTESYRIQLQTKAEVLAEKISEFITTPNEEESSAYLRAVEDLETADIWILSNHGGKHPMSSTLENVNASFNIKSLEKNRRDILKNAFRGKTDYGTKYSKSHGLPMVTVGVPIKDVSNNVAGAVLLSSPVSNLKSVISSSKSLIILSTCVALIISFILAVVFAKKLSSPISKMRKTSLQLAEGDYKARTGIRRKDELGELAASIDVLSERLKENEEEHKNMEQMRMDFFANVSHELRTPITVVRAYIEALSDGVVAEPEKVKQYYGRILDECGGMQRLVGDLLLLSKMQNPEFTIEKEPVNVVQIFSDIIRSIRAIKGQKKINVNLEKEKDVYIIMGDYDRLRQMFRVIFDNAVKFSNENSNIYIKMTGTDILSISIRDEGIGIAPEELPNIFEKFYKSKLRQNAQGTGLGLAIAKAIALKHEGTIEVKSEVKKGTEFIFTFHTVSEQQLEQMS